MRKRTTLSILGALLLGLALAAGYASADVSADKKKEPTKGSAKGKPGDACKTATDCDQTSQMQSCSAGKCRIEQPPPPT